MNAKQKEAVAMNSNYRKVEEWKREGKNFLVTVKHHTERITEEPACYDSEGPHRWCVYAYIYPKHPHFARFDGTETMWQEAACALPMHGGPSLVRAHIKIDDKSIGSYQVGSDYHHHGDWSYTQMADEKDAYSVFADADELFDWLCLEPSSSDEPAGT